MTLSWIWICEISANISVKVKRRRLSAEDVVAMATTERRQKNLASFQSCVLYKDHNLLYFQSTTIMHFIFRQCKTRLPIGLKSKDKIKT